MREPRPNTPVTVHPDGVRSIRVKRACNGCGGELGDATDAEIELAVSGNRLTDVRDECPQCVRRHAGLGIECKTCAGRCRIDDQGVSDTCPPSSTAEEATRWTIQPIDPDEAVAINGVQVTGRQLAEARQELSHRGVHNPQWAQLSSHDQDVAALSGGSWLRALAELVAAPAYCVDGACGRAAAGRHVPHPLVPLADENHWNDVECEQRPHCTISAHHSIDGGDDAPYRSDPAGIGWDGTGDHMPGR